MFGWILAGTGGALIAATIGLVVTSPPEHRDGYNPGIHPLDRHPNVTPFRSADCYDQDTDQPV